MDFDPSGSRPGDTDILTSVGGDSDIYVAKYAPDDSLVWVTRMGGMDREIGAAIAVDGGGNVFVTGPFKGSANFGSTTLTSVDNLDDGYIAKLDPAGSVVWAKRWGQVGMDVPRGMDSDAAGNVYVVGYRTGGAGVSGGIDIMKWEGDGDTSWTVALNTGTASVFCDLEVDTGGNVFVTSNASSSTDFDPAPNKTKTLPTGGAFVLKLTATGAFGWVSNLSGGVSSSDLALDTSGNVFVVSSYSGTPRFSQYGARTQNLPTGLTATGRDFVAKLNSNGGLVWARQIDSDSNSNISNIMWGGLATDAAGSVYLTGMFSGTIDFNPGAGSHPKTSAGGNDAFVLKLTSAGNFAWADTFGGTGNESGGDITVDPSGLIHMTGNYSGTVDFDPDPNAAFDLTNQGTSAHMFLVKLRSN